MSANIFKRPAKRFDFQYITRGRRTPYKNLFDMISRYPSYGLGFVVWNHKEWPENDYFHIKEIKVSFKYKFL